MKLLILAIFFFLTQLCLAQWVEIKSDSDREYYELMLCNNSDSLLVLGDIGDTTGYIKIDINTFQEKLTPTTSLPVAVHHYSDTASWILTDVGELFFSNDCFSSSYQLTSDLSIFSVLSDIHFVTDSLGFVCEDQNGTTRMFKTENRGLNWVQVGTSSNVGGNELVTFNDTLLCVDENGAFVSSDTGATWYVDYYQTINDRWFSDVYKSEVSGRMIFVGQGYDQNLSTNFGAIAISSDYGETWFFQDIFAMNRILDIEMVNDTVGYITGQPQGTQIAIYKTVDGGLTWLPQGYSVDPIGSLRFHRIKCQTEDTCFVCGRWGKILMTTNGGGATDIGVEELDEAKFLAISPNPTSTQLNFKVDQSINCIEIYNISGQLVLTRSGDLRSIDVSDLSEGIYSCLVRFEDGGIATRKIVVQR